MASTMGGGYPLAPQSTGNPGGYGAQQSPQAPASVAGSAGQQAAYAGMASADPKTSSSTGQSPLSGSPANPGNTAAQRIIKRRSPVACRRCRRMRSKCVHVGAKPPCEGCRLAGVNIEECVFPTRGAPDMDREYRHPRMKGDKARKESNRPPRPQPPGSGDGFPPGTSFASPAITGIPTDPWDLLPPLEQVVDAVNTFTRQYFQLGFIPRHTFIQQLREQPRSISLFLLLSLLSVSGRMTPSLVEAFGGAGPTAELFMERASTIALTELYQEPTLPRCQAFYLLSLAQQGSGYQNLSYVNLGIALRMAILMRLHREESYILEEPTPTMLQNAESARRTLWMLYSQDNLHADPLAPISLSERDITTLLPSNEEDFNNGVQPLVRPALENTPPAREKPALVNMPARSLFATLMQSHQLWGIVLRRTITKNSGKLPWDINSEYALINKKLNDWESQLPAEHLWSRELLREHRAKGLDLAYVAVTMVTRLCNILIRKAYIPFMLMENGPKQHRNFWKAMSGELFSNVQELFTQIDCWIQEREPGDGTGAQLAVFCVYSCAFMAAYLHKYPKLCPDTSITQKGEHMLDRTMDILKRSTNVWPLARRWIESIERFIVDKPNPNTVQNNSHESGMAEGKDPIPSALHPPLAHLAPSGPSNTPFDDRRQLARQLGADSPHARSASPNVGGNTSNGLGGGSIHSDTTRHLPELRRDATLMNSPMRLPPPQPSPNLLSNAASHYATAPTSLPAPLVLPPPAPQGLPISGGAMRTPTGFQPQMQSHQHHLHHQQPSPNQGTTNIVPNGGGMAVVSSGMGHSLAPVQLGDSPTLPQLPPMPSATQTSPDSGVGNLMIQRYDNGSLGTTAEAEAAAVLVGGMVHHGAIGHDPSHVHHQHQQQPGDLYLTPQLSDQGHNMHIDPMGGRNMSLLDTMNIHDVQIADDGYGVELRAWMHGSHIQAGDAWAAGLYGFS